jgi:hypothetical protein
MEKFFASLKRLLEPRAQPPAESTEQPTADRPPPPAGSAPYREPEAAHYQEPASPDVAAADDVTEVRALLESVAETPVAAEPETQLRLPAEPEPAPSIAETPASQPEVAEVASAPSDGVGNTLVLTLATPVTTFMVERSSATVGRGPENPIRLDDLSVSRRHARIAYRQGGYWLSDLGSMGGTWVNGTRLSAPRRIAAGEVIDIGHCRLTVGFSADAAKTSARKTASRRAG